MAHKYRQRHAANIRAFHATKKNCHDYDNWPQWMKDAHKLGLEEKKVVGSIYAGGYEDGDGELSLVMPTGTFIVLFGMWIVNIDGNFVVMDNRLFEYNFELVEY